ncbi:MAG: NUDIX hydrolase [Georgenia sp.]
MSTPSSPPDARLHRQPGDGWVDCACGNQHWGRNGAAGLLLWRAAPGGPQVVLQHRALWSHHGGTWGLPGGALSDDETPVSGAVREAVEEAAVVPAALRVRACRALVHPDWTYTTVLAQAVEPFEPRVSDPESLEVAWIDVAALDDYDLLPAFADALPELLTMLRRLVVVVDAANVVGSRPDGWWKDRRRATTILRDHLARLARCGLDAAGVDLPGRRWYPEFVLVTEGAANGVDPAPGVDVVAAPAGGDDTVVDVVAGLLDGAAPSDEVVVTVTTADRELGERVRALGARTAGPHLVRH